MPPHRRPVPSSGATDPPAAAGSGQKTLPEVFRHKSVNDWIYATVKISHQLKSGVKMLVRANFYAWQVSISC